MEAQHADELPVGPLWQYEPKWDGFRALARRDGPRIELQSKAGRPLTRYFPELAAALTACRAKRFLLDGEIIVRIGDRLSFDDLLQRIHPAASRIAKLSSATPATLVVFDLLRDERDKDWGGLPLEKRRPRLEAFFKHYLVHNSSVRLSPATTDLATAQQWYARVGGDLDGIIAKRRDLSYRAGARDGMVKVKRHLTADCVVGGFRYATRGDVVGSLLLGLYDEAGLLNHVGFTSGLKAAERGPLTRKLKALVGPPGFTGAAPGGPSRWSTERSTQWEPLKPELVVEVDYDHFTGGRFRHGTRLVRWRPDKSPRQCTLDQIQAASRAAALLQ